ncbi:MAG: arginine deiminase-related protein [Zetaproteobacteria bacterium]|nr:arginine deiminase-related protein [Zetaproteobacteria bacterium]
MVGNINLAQNGAAIEQWGFLENTLKECAKVKLIEPEDQLPDMVFTANGALIHNKKAIISRFKPKERQGESQYFKRWFEENGFQVFEVPEDMAFEGAGDALFDRCQPKRLWAAYGFRSSKASHEWIKNLLEVEVFSLELVDPRFYHLDTCFCPLDLGHIMYYSKAFSTASQRLIQTQIGSELLIDVSEEDAKNFSLNAVNVGTQIILGNASEGLKDRLRLLGYQVKETPVPEFKKAGGATKCLTLQLGE